MKPTPGEMLGTIREGDLVCKKTEESLIYGYAICIKQQLHIVDPSGLLHKIPDLHIGYKSVENLTEPDKKQLLDKALAVLAEEYTSARAVEEAARKFYEEATWGRSEAASSLTNFLRTHKLKPYDE